ncbi:hypothetical protein E2C01_048963 [Portunus trituberculatus]|uniref:Uncharacterized protein n=1 Tax=Portunus trituberculatus TaxID=210409 RepID=A0A5B7G7Y5_PORTR|nr:hypothetical protein [Portunus trituberculatus]
MKILRNTKRICNCRLYLEKNATEYDDANLSSRIFSKTGSSREKSLECLPLPDLTWKNNAINLALEREKTD